MPKKNAPGRAATKKVAEKNKNGNAGRNGATQAAPAPPSPPKPPAITVQRLAGKIYSHVRHKWLVETPEERVRQNYLTVLVNEYGYALEQITEEESVVGRGSGQARADFLIWRTLQDRNDSKPPLIVVECKSDNVTIKTADYHQGDHYARMCGAKFFITHNTRETRYWRVRQDRMPGYLEEIENIPHADASDKDIEELISKLRVFKETEFADLLHQCHNVIRNRDHLDPAAAFDEIAKILFIKSAVEREMRKKRMRQNLFTADWLDTQLLVEDPLQDLFRKTKEDYRNDRIFDEQERLNLKPATGREIVRLLEKYNLSDTGEDVKGIAFERFLGRTFRGDIGQFFTPRSIVEFMVRMVDPKEGDVVCDPASGSGGFLIRFFEIVREQILADADRQYQDYVRELEAKKNLSETKRAELLRARFDEIQKTLDSARKGSRLWTLANRCIYGCDANDRMARTSKMNMIMHGDGHGGVHHHNGFINVNGIFEGRFNIILTNPPFGANVESTDKVTDADVAVSDEEYERYAAAYGDLYREAQARVQAAKGKPIVSLFELPQANRAKTERRARNASSKGEKVTKVRTEILFIERCLALLAPGGRLGIVLPESVFNNPSLARVRAFCEDRAFLRAVVSLPPETFMSSGASVKASLLFMQKYTDEEKAKYDEIKAKAVEEVEAKHAPAIEAETARLLAEIEAAKASKDAQKREELYRELREYQKAMKEQKAAEVRQLLKERFDYRVFLYDALDVGINAVGDGTVPNELIPNDRMPAGVTVSVLELAQQFKQNPEGFVVPEGMSIASRCFVLNWRVLSQWDLKGARAADFRIKHPNFQPMGTFIEEATELVRPAEEPDKEWPVYGVNNREGVFFSHYQKGAEFNSAYKRIRKDWFFHNPTRANVGSLGRVPTVPDDALTSPEYQVWRIKKGLLPEYVEVLIRTPFFLDLVEFHRVGAVKQRLFVQNLMEIPIPVLEESEQRKAIRAWQEAQTVLEQAKSQVDTALLKVDEFHRGLK